MVDCSIGNATCFGPLSSSNFLQQRKITYVDNPFDEQASMTVYKCDVKYMNYPRTDDKVAATKKDVSTSSSRSGEPFDEAEEKSSKSKLGVWTFGADAQSKSGDISDWSCLFSPVQCQNNSPSGEIQLSLSYDPWLSTLKVAIIKAKSLTCPVCSSKTRNSGIICVGTFINISLLSNNKQIQTRRTEMRTRKTEIFFYEKFSFLVQRDTVRECSLRCRAVHKVGSLIKRNHVIGQVVIGADDGLRHWGEMLQKPKKNVTQWHYLKEC